LSECILVFVKFLENESLIDEQDLSTIEFSKRLRELTSWRVIAASMISKGELAEYASREIYSRGIDHAHVVLIKEVGVNQDLYLSALIAKEVIERYGCKINVFGERSSDTSFGGLAGYVAGMMSMAYLRFVKKVVSVNDDGVRAIVDLDGEVEVKARLPMVLVPVGELYPPSPVSVREKLEARKKKPIITEAELREAPKLLLIGMRKPTYRKRLGVKLASVEELADVIKRIAGGQI